MTRSNTLLPPGFYDALHKDAVNERVITNAIIDRLQCFSYDYIRPPLLEFEDTLLEQASDALKQQTFRLRDPESNRMLGLRADITPQIKRMATQRLRDAPRPLRLCYTGQVVLAGGDTLHKDRQLSQAGLELIGSNASEADIEIITATLEALLSLPRGAIKERMITLDFHLPCLLSELLAGLEPALRQRLNEAVKLKQPALLEQIDHPASAAVRTFLSLRGTPEEIVSGLRRSALPDPCLVALDRLETLLSAISDLFPALRITLDPLEAVGFDYYSDIAFSLFVDGAQQECGRGGRYRLQVTNEEAVGFTFDVSVLARFLAIAPELKAETVSNRTAYQKAKALRDQGKMTLDPLS